jgi:hypothetical protein
LSPVLPAPGRSESGRSEPDEILPNLPGPEFRGHPVEIRYARGLRDTAGHEAHAATDLRERLIVLDGELRGNKAEHRRILTHELFHFVWVRLGNVKRREWEDLLAREWRSRARGEAGWSAEWRKRMLHPDDVRRRSQAWREYCCESFCDTAAWIYAEVSTECTLAKRHRNRRKLWALRFLEARPLPI